MQGKHVTHGASAIFQCACMIAALVGIAGISGCSKGDRPPLGTVHGKITFDGKPLAGANVGFTPKSGGRQSSGVTDAEGNYVLKYIRDVMGAKIDTHTVCISTARDRAGKTETVPARYNVEGTLQKDVVAGDNVIDFEMTTR